MTTVGFDFGNLNCVIARCGRGGVDVLLNGASQRQNACMVSLQGKERFMGNEAESIMRSNFKNTALNMKRLLGRQFKEPEIQEELARCPGLSFEELEDGTVGIKVAYNDDKLVLSIEQCVAMMLTKLVKITLDATGAKPGDCVVSIPGYYTDAQRQAMLNACDIAQLHCLRLLHEGTACALEYGMFKSAKGLFEKDKPSRVMFLDLGHSSYSCTVASFVTGKVTVNAAAHDRSLGGRDFDDVIAKKISAAFQAKHKDDPWSNAKARMKLLVAAEKAKKTLSPTGVTEARINCECLMNDIDFNLALTLAEFVEDSEPLLARLHAPIAQALAQSGLEASEVSHVEIVGGSTRLGFVKERMADILIGCGVPIDKTAMNCGLMTTMNADEAVSRGTAWQAALLSTRFRVKEFAVVEAVAFPIQLQWEAAASGGEGDGDEGEEGEEGGGGGGGGKEGCATVFKKNEASPNAKKVTFRRSKPFSVAAVYEDVSDLPPGTDKTLRTFTVETPADLPTDGPAPKIRVNVKHTLHGTLAVSSAQLMEEIKDPEPPADGAKAKAAEGGGDEAAKEKDEAKAGEEAKTGEGAAAAPAEEEPPKKKRFKKVELKVTASTVGMSQSRLSAAQELEVQMAHQDKVVEETGKARNDVESYIYSQRDALIGPLQEFCTEAEKTDQEAALTAAEDWLYYGDGYDAQKSVYVEKLKDLKKKGEGASYRSAEKAGRANGIAALKTSCDEYKKWLVASDSDDKYAHISAEAKATVRSAVEATEKWLFESQEAQAKLAANVDPALTTEDLSAKRRSLVETCQPVLATPKPKPPPKEEPKEENAASGGDGDKAGSADAKAGSADGKEGGDDAAAAEGKEGDPAGGDAKDSAEAAENAAAGGEAGEAKTTEAAPMEEDK